MRLNAQERDFILKDVRSMLDEHNIKKLQKIKKTKYLKTFRRK